MKTKYLTATLTVTSFLLALLLFPALTIAERPQVTGAHTTVYMEIHNITQGIGEGAHPNEVPIEAVAHGVRQPYDPDTGQASDIRQHEALHILKSLDQISPLFPYMVVTGQHMAHVTFRFYRKDESGLETHFYTIMLNQARAVNYAIEEGGQKEAAFESVSFVYEIITWTDVSSGTSRSDHWRAPGGG